MAQAAHNRSLRVERCVYLGGFGGCGRAGSADDALELVTELVGFVGRELYDQAATTFERDAHDDAATLLGDLHRPVAGPRLHGRHAIPLSGCSSRVAGPLGRCRSADAFRIRSPGPAVYPRACGSRDVNHSSTIISDVAPWMCAGRQPDRPADAHQRSTVDQ